MLAELEKSTEAVVVGLKSLNQHSGQLERNRGEEGQTGIVSVFHFHHAIPPTTFQGSVGDLQKELAYILAWDSNKLRSEPTL